MSVSDSVRCQITLSPDTPYTLLPTWVDFTDTVRSAEWSYSRQGGPTGVCSPSSARFVVSNRDGRWDPASGLGGATWAGRVERWQKVRIIISANDFFTATVRFTGFVTDVRLLDGRFDGYAEVTCVDQLGILAENNLEDLVRPEELTGVRASAIFDAAGLPGLFSNLEQNGVVVVAAATLSGQALAAAQECARAEGGHLWCSQAGLLRFTDRHYFYDSVSLSGFALGASVIKQALIPKSLRSFSNVAEGASSGASGRVRKFGTTPSGYPASSRREMSTSAVWDADSASTAEWLQRHSTFSGSRVDGVVLDVLRGSDTTVLDGLVAGTLKWLDTVTVSYTPQHGAATSQTCWVESETHRVTSDGRWELQLGLSPYSTSYATAVGNSMAWGDVIGTLTGAV